MPVTAALLLPFRSQTQQREAMMIVKGRLRYKKQLAFSSRHQLLPMGKQGRVLDCLHGYTFPNRFQSDQTQPFLFAMRENIFFAMRALNNVCKTSFCLLWVQDIFLFAMSAKHFFCLLWVKNIFLFAEWKHLFVCYECKTSFCLLWVQNIFLFAMSAKHLFVCYECKTSFCLLWVNNIFLFAMSAKHLFVCYECKTSFCLLWE